jgi:hypothetical protein
VRGKIPNFSHLQGGRGDFWGIFSEGKGYLFQKAKMLPEILFASRGADCRRYKQRKFLP